MPGFTIAPGADASAIASGQARLEDDLRSVSRDVSDRVLIVVGEVAANAVEHGRGEVAVVWYISDGRVDLDVLGPGPDVQQIRAATLPPDRAVRGRGLFLIRTLATAVESCEGRLRIRFDATILGNID